MTVAVIYLLSTHTMHALQDHHTLIPECKALHENMRVSLRTIVVDICKLVTPLLVGNMFTADRNTLLK